MASAAPEQLSPRVFASPLARRLARKSGLDIAGLAGSGPHGRVIERDVKAALASGATGKTASPGAAATPATLETTRKFYAVDSYEEIPHDAMRKAIARRLTESVQTVPHFYLNADCRIDALLRLREDFNAGAPTGVDGSPVWKTSVNDYIVKALALALQKTPDANVTYTPEAMLRHQGSHIGVAVSIPGGLITPIIRNAHAKTLPEISMEIRDLAARGRERKLRPQEYEGGVSAVSNLGMYGVESFSAIINPPQSTILAVGAGEQRMIVVDGAPQIAWMMRVTLSCDHRAIDGALGARLLAEIRRYLEHPAAMFV
jgi:pyruvate dehydrogenase E2 component (dihydrolipoamide acetyltransferase)